MKKPLISIIIPVYNVEQYLDYCMQSVLEQSYKNIEIILVDDGSVDSSGEMCDMYAKMDERVKVLHKKNGGLSSARNAGMEIIKGEYFSFLDSDDYIRSDYISKMYKYIVNDKSDMVICSVKKVIGNEDYRIIQKDSSEHFLFEKEVIKYKMLSRQVPMYAPSKLYKAKLAIKTKFPEGRLYEDIPTIWNVVKDVNKVTYTNDEIYFYRQRLDSIVNTKYKHERMDQLYFSEDILKEISKTDSLYNIAMSRCFFAAADNMTYVTKEYSEDWIYLSEALKKYKFGVFKDSTAEKKIKIMAILATISPNLVRIAGKLYKKINYCKLKMKNSSRML